MRIFQNWRNISIFKFVIGGSLQYQGYKGEAECQPLWLQALPVWLQERRSAYLVHIFVISIYFNYFILPAIGSVINETEDEVDSEEDDDWND